MEEADALVTEVLRWLPELSFEQLLVVYTDHLGQPDVQGDRRNQQSVLKLIMRFLSSEEVEQSEDGGLAHFLQIHTYLDGLGVKQEVVDPNAAVAAAVTQQTTANTNPAPPLATTPLTTTANTPPAVVQNLHVQSTTSAATSTNITPTTATTDYATLKKVLRKDWKLKGSIGRPGEKEKLTFSGLAYQINQAEKKGYEDDDICEEVIKGVTDDVLRSLLEGKTNLTLAKLRKLLRSHFKEKDPTTLFNELSRSAQLSSEDASYFVMRMIDLRTKVVFATKEVDSRVNYPEDLVREQFIRTVTTGLRNDNIRNEIKQLFAQNLEEEDLLEKLTQAESDELERLSKLEGLQGTSAVAAVNAIGGDSAVSDLARKVEALTDVCERNNAEIVALKAEVKDDRGKSRLSDAARKRRKCIPCDENNIQICRHCYACGSSRHVRTNCDQGN